MAVEVRIMGFKSDSDTRKAQRFFAERRIKVHFIDLGANPVQPGELRRFAQVLGLTDIIDRAGPAFLKSGLAGRGLSEPKWLEALANQPKLLRVPLCRCGQAVTVGLAEETWREWAAG